MAFSRCLLLIGLIQLSSISVIANSGAQFCLAFPGNGQKVFAHFGSIARIFETIGTKFDLGGLAGESSGSVAAFLMENIAASDLVHTCGPIAAPVQCSLEERAARIALLTKSLMGYADAIEHSPEIAALTGVLPAFNDLIAINLNVSNKFHALGEIRKKLNVILRNTHYLEVLNSAWKERLKALLKPVGWLNVESEMSELKKVLDVSNALNFKDNTAIFREGLINFDYLALIIGRIADFYSSEIPGDRKRLRQFVNACSETSKGKTWRQLSIVVVDPELFGANQTCGGLFNKALTTYRDRVSSRSATKSGSVMSRVGEKIPAIVASAIIKGEQGIKNYYQGLKYFNQTKLPVPEVVFRMNPRDMGIGYWGSRNSLVRISVNPNGYEDARTLAFHSMGEKSWYEALRMSTAEPGGSVPRLALDGNQRSVLSVGGWPDPSPVRILKNLGCENVVLVNRPVDFKGFYENVFKIYNWGDPSDASSVAAAHFGAEKSVRSSEWLARRDADVLWCNDWDQETNPSPDRLFEIGYNSREVFSYKANLREPWGFLVKTTSTDCELANPARPSNREN